MQTHTGNKSFVEMDMDEVNQTIDRQLEVITFSSEKIENIISKAKSAKEKANQAKEKEVGRLFGNQDVIKALQEAVLESSEALSEITDAQKDFFEQLQKLGNATKSLFVLGVSNLSITRVVIKTLMEKLEHADRSKLNERAIKEIKDIILKLKAQEDLCRKVEKHSELITKAGQNIISIEEKYQYYISHVDKTLEYWQIKDQDKYDKLQSTCDNVISENNNLKAKLKRTNFSIIFLSVISISALLLNLLS